MNNSERLIDCSKNPLARELLRTADMDAAPENTAAKVALALGLGSSAVITTVAVSAAASGGLASGTSSTVVASAAAAAPAGVAAAAPIAAGAVVAAPVAASAVTAVGMLKVMTAVSIACGTLSYGGVKLALKVTEKPTITQEARALKPAPVVRSAQRKSPARSVAAFPDVQDSEQVAEANLPAPPPPPNNDEDDVAAAREPEPRPPSAAHDAPQQGANAAVLGRHNNQESSTRNAVSPRTERKSETVMPTQPAAPVAHAASFPSEDAHPAPAASVASAPSAASNLEHEVAQLDHARSALAAGQPVQALRELDAYRTQNPRGILAAESVVLRVKALLALGQRSAAEAEARPLLVNAPQSRHAERLRSLLGAAANTQ